ncbi:hypothetical protein [Novosphingobium olei]|uniref:hypothetical protein n=1 Tax=Novosphingobium olei TaxID=2728851 RepID=UPI00308B21F9|nr:hypothetical protein NSDW_32780 [Novosphingobium olei]
MDGQPARQSDDGRDRGHLQAERSVRLCLPTIDRKWAATPERERNSALDLGLNAEEKLERAKWIVRYHNFSERQFSG